MSSCSHERRLTGIPSRRKPPKSASSSRVAPARSLGATSALDQTDTSVTVADSFTNALRAFNQSRADALMWDDTVLVGVAAADRSAKLTNDLFL
jgi:hypothetical protein